MALVPLSRKGRRASSRPDTSAYLPTTRAEMEARGWDELDVLIINGDAYVDHPAFGGALIGRFLEGRGYRVGMIAQPKWDDISEVSRMGPPRLFVGITSGNLDSMLNKLTAQKKVRSEDQYSPGGRTNMRPNRASIVYGNLCRQAFPGVPIVLGGIEASLRRIAHYDYWSDSIRRSVLLDAKADMLIFGMGERPVWELADRLAAGQRLEQVRDIRGTAHVLRKGQWENIEPSRFIRDRKPVRLPSYEEIKESNERFSEMSGAFQKETNPGNGRPLIQPHGHEAVYLNPPAEPLSTELMDELYDLPFTRYPHPSYDAGIPAYETVKHSIVTMRGCFGGCSFCSITEHEGRVIQSRSAESVLREVRALRRMDDFSGVISDVGGPTANMYGLGCKLLEAGEGCLDRDCLSPDICPALRIDSQSEGYRRLLGLVKQTQGVKHAYVSSGIRYDMLRYTRGEKKGELLPLHHDLVKDHTPGRMKLAPEHASPAVLEAMNKPGFEVYEEYEKDYKEDCASMGKDQHLVNYFIVGHPGTGMPEAVELFEKLLERNYSPEQAQEFIPLPMTRGCIQYTTGIDPITRKELYVPRGGRERRLQKALVRWKVPENRKLVEEALALADREDLLKPFHHALRMAGGEGKGRGGKKRPGQSAGLDTCG